jgi:hypothetical protein
MYLVKGKEKMINFTPREYSIRELYESYNRKETILSPKFQRRSVWEIKAKSFLIDSIIRELPIPRIFIRENSSLEMTVRREIVDGQQRLSAIFDFMNDGFTISKSHNEEFGGRHYTELPDQIRQNILKYTISAVILIDLSDVEVIDIFARLNTYSIKLNNQELLNSQFFGLYKKTIYRLASDYHSFWMDTNILSEKGISRMDDAKLITEIMAVIVTGEIETNSFNYNKKLYDKYDDDFPEQDMIESSIKQTIDLLSKIYGDKLRDTIFTSVPMFYSTILVLYHMNHPIKCFDFDSVIFSENSISKLRTALDEIDAIANLPIDENKKYEEFLVTLKKNTTTPNVRITRCNFIGSVILKYLI